MRLSPHRRASRHTPAFHRLAQHLTLPTLQNTLAALHRTRALLERNVNARLALEVMLLDWPVCTQRLSGKK